MNKIKKALNPDPIPPVPTPESAAIQFATFEPTLKKLQEAVQRLESSELSLEDAFKSLEEGTQAFFMCRQMLKAARERVEILTQKFPEDIADWQPFTWQEKSSSNSS